MTLTHDKLDIRTAITGDIAALADSLSPIPSRRQIEQRLEDCSPGYREMYVAVVDGLPVGTVSIGGEKTAEVPDALYLFALDASLKYRNRGIGAAMISEVENIARDRGLKYVTLGVGIDNDDARRLYERLGFSQSGEPVWKGWIEFADDGAPISKGDTCAPMRKRVA